MQITSRFTIAVHIIAFVDYFGEETQVTSKMLSGSIHANPVIIRNVISSLNDAGILSSHRGKKGIHLAKDVNDVTLYDVYEAVDCIEKKGLFHFHEEPEPACPIGRNIHAALNPHLEDVQKTMEDELKTITLAEITGDIRERILMEK